MFVADEPKGRVWSFLDVTERKRAEKVLKEANKKLHLLNTVTRHDVLNQLTALSSLLQLAQKRYDNQEANKLLARAGDSVDTIERQIAFMSDYQDIDIHTPRWQNPGDILARVIPAIPLETIHMEYDLGNIEIYADPLLEKVFLNLVDNAVRHGGGITRMAFYAQTDDDELVLYCSDDGRGIAAEEKERIFNLGYGKHTGFGLYLAREILSITGISLDEIGKAGQGALFRIRVPRESFRFVQERRTSEERERQPARPADVPGTATVLEREEQKQQ
jgi:signal transduction histidine kinase